MPRLMLRVKCPRCNHEQNTTSIKSVKCFRCDRAFTIYPKKKKSRIVRIVKGTREMLMREYKHKFGPIKE